MAATVIAEYANIQPQENKLSQLQQYEIYVGVNMSWIAISTIISLI